MRAIGTKIVQCTHSFGLEEGWEEGVAPGD